MIAYKEMSLNDYEMMKNNFEGLESNLTVVSLFGIQDTLKPQVPYALEMCKTAGLKVIMCTGDNLETAKTIAGQAGILPKAVREDDQINSSASAQQRYTCMTGKDFREAVGGLKQLSDPDSPNGEVEVVANIKKFREIKRYLKVLARSTPLDKYVLVTGLKNTNEIVAVTGDGTNDAPALTKADVGFSMGIAGTDVAKGASDIILLDDDFSSILTSIEYGRNVYENVRQFLQFQLTTNFVAIMLVFISYVLLKDSVMSPIQFLWINLIMDTFAALALASEPPAHDILFRFPQEKDTDIISPVMWRNIIG